MKKESIIGLIAITISLFAAGCGKEEMVIPAAVVDHTNYHAMAGAATAVSYELEQYYDARELSIATTKANMSLMAVLHPARTPEPTPFLELEEVVETNEKKEAKPSAEPVAAATPASVTYSVDLTEEEKEAIAEVIRLTNSERSAAGKSALKEDATLTALAMKRAEEATRKWGHTRPNGKSWDSILSGTAFSNTYAGENLVMGTGFTPANAISNWMKSEGHKANILSSKYNCIGVGVYKSGGNVYYVQIFAKY